MFASLTLIFLLVHGLTGQEIEINVGEISSIRRPSSENHFGRGTHCVIYMNNGKFILVRETCMEVIRGITEVTGKEK